MKHRLGKRLPARQVRRRAGLLHTATPDAGGPYSKNVMRALAAASGFLAVIVLLEPGVGPRRTRLIAWAAPAGPVNWWVCMPRRSAAWMLTVVSSMKSTGEGELVAAGLTAGQQ